MKKLLLALIICVLLSSASFAQNIVYEKPDVSVVVNGVTIESSNVPIIVNSRTLVPLRALLIALGVPDNNENIQWIGEKRQVKVFHEDVSLQLDIDSDIAYINNEVKKLDSPAIIHKSRTYLPAKFVGEALGYQVLWDAYSPAVIVCKNEAYELSKNVLTTVKESLQGITNYEAEFTSEILISTSNSDYEEYKQKVVYEKVDKEKNLMEVKTIYNEGNATGTLEYFSDFAKYYSRDYANGFPAASYQVSEYNNSMYGGTPFATAKKLVDFSLDELAYGMMECIENGEMRYTLYTTANAQALLNGLANAGLYYETVDGNGKIKSARIIMNVEQYGMLPTSIKIETEREITGSEEYGVDNVVTEVSSFNLIVKYDQYLTINLPQ